MLTSPLQPTEKVPPRSLLGLEFSQASNTVVLLVQRSKQSGEKKGNLSLVSSTGKVGFLCSSVGKESAYNAGDLGLIPGLGRSSGEGNGNPLQYSCLENPMDCSLPGSSVHGVTRVGHNLVAKPPPPQGRHRAMSPSL